MFFGQKKGFGVQPAQQKFKTEKIKLDKKPPPLKSKLSSNDVREGTRINTIPQRSKDNTSRLLSVPNTASGAGKKRKAEASANSSPRRSPNPSIRRSPSQLRLESDSESEDEDESPVGSKRVKVENGDADPNRKLRDLRAFLVREEGGKKIKMINAADTMLSMRKAKKGEGNGGDCDTVFLRYPSVGRGERYQLVSEGDIINPYDEEMINAFEEIMKIVDIVKDVYLTEEQSIKFRDPENGIYRQVQKAGNIIKNMLDRKPYDKALVKELLPQFKDAVSVYNGALGALVKDGSIARNLDNMHSLPSNLVKIILQQVYDRVVSPEVELLQKYQNGTNYVYGELLFPFISRILKEDTRMKSDQVFVDLGSGVGNVVLQAALQIGCESWGCEYMPNASRLAAAQKKEFSARCHAWGISTGSVHLEAGDFLENSKIHEAMRRADVIVVNNQVFQPELNQSLLNLFLDLKDGCKIVSLQSFVPDGHEITARNRNNPVNVLAVERRIFGDGDVSWQPGGGDYYIATKDSSRLAKFSNWKD
ncbi:Histone-lysine N- H3 lysine-79 specific protein [Rutstroemia sp. NJR-2017a WRK4]|nr:Histone-lysine N- H3 lysine-79 specific protein [Rutstroemia sp. NJR-2017a WRK4]